MNDDKNTAYYPGSVEAVYNFLDPCDREHDVINAVLEAAEEAGIKDEYAGSVGEVNARFTELRAIVEAEYARRREAGE